MRHSYKLCMFLLSQWQRLDVEAPVSPCCNRVVPCPLPLALHWMLMPPKTLLLHTVLRGARQQVLSSVQWLCSDETATPTQCPRLLTVSHTGQISYTGPHKATCCLNPDWLRQCNQLETVSQIHSSHSEKWPVIGPLVPFAIPTNGIYWGLWRLVLSVLSNGF